MGGIGRHVAPTLDNRMIMKNYLLSFIVVILLFAAFSANAESRKATAAPSEEVSLRLRYGTFKEAFVMQSSTDMTVSSGPLEKRLNGGMWRFSAKQVKLASQCFHVFPKTFPPSQEEELQSYLRQWKARGYQPEVRTFGRTFRSAAGKVLDNRVHWVSLARCKTKSQADALVAKLKAEQVFAWIRAETIAPGSAVISVTDTAGKTVFQSDAPLEIRSDAPLALADVKTGFMKDRRADRTVTGPLRLRIGPDGAVEVLGELPLETYLRGVLPAEMPASWPIEALKAQAVAARSEVLAALSGKFDLEGFDFTTTEECRAYAGLGGHQPTTNRALNETSGMILTHAGQVATTVFCACCGGWTEDNEKVWSGPPNPVLRGIPDFPPGKNPAPAGLKAYGMQRWLTTSPSAWCADHNDFRWKKKLTKRELSEIMSKIKNIGDVQEVRAGTRGSSGRLIFVDVVGSRGHLRLTRELAIRQTIGGLPSAMFIMSPEKAGSGPTPMMLYGGGSGHGVGLCQQGARAMADRGLAHSEILTHYFTGVALERLAS